MGSLEPMHGGAPPETARARSSAAAQGPPLWAIIAVAVFMLGFMGAVFALGIRSTTGDSISPEEYASRIARLLPFGYAFGAGVVASVNPCGFLMLPAYVGYYLGDREPGAGPDEVTFQQLGRAVAFGIMVTLGFVVLFAAVGSAIASGGTAIVRGFPWAGLSIGGALAALGLWLLVTGRSLGLAAMTRIGRPRGRGLGSAFLYGIAYGAASLSCTLPIFLVVVGFGIARYDLGSSVAQFVSYGLGMGAVVVAVSLSAAAFKGAVTQALRGMTPYVHRLSALLLAGAGAYLIVYWIVLGDLFE